MKCFGLYRKKEKAFVQKTFVRCPFASLIPLGSEQLTYGPASLEPLRTILQCDRYIKCPHTDIQN